MLSKKTKKVLIILIILMFILITTILIAIFIMEKENTQEDFVEYGWIEENTQLKVEDLKSNDEYYTVKECIENYMYFEIIEEKNKSYIDKWYINSGRENKITKASLSGYTTYEPNKIQYVSKDKIYIYFVQGEIIIDEGFAESKECNLIVKLDYNTHRYSIIPEIIEDIYLEKNIFEGITDEKYSEFGIPTVSNTDIASRYLQKFVFSSIKNIEESYKLIDEQYKEKKFNNNIENYKNYLNNNYNYYNEISPIVTDCKVYIYDDYTLYISKDLKGNSYIFIEKYVNDFSVMLDTETIKLEEIESIDKGENNYVSKE